jgi:hypothetical protein
MQERIRREVRADSSPAPGAATEGTEGRVQGPLPDWETPNEISGQNVPVTYSTKCESANPSHMTDGYALLRR